MNRNLHLAAALFSILLISACGAIKVKVGQDFDVDVFASRIEQGVTAQDTVRSWLGEPSSIGISMATDGSKFDEWTYYFAEGEMSEMSQAKLKILQIKFDQRGIVRGYNWSAPRRQ